MAEACTILFKNWTNRHEPIKLVIEGNPLIVSSAAIQNQDLTQEYLYGQQFGIGFILSDGAIGRYTIS